MILVHIDHIVLCHVFIATGDLTITLIIWQYRCMNFKITGIILTHNIRTVLYLNDVN